MEFIKTMNILTRPILEIDLNKLVENYNFLKTKSFGAIPAAVIKDDAYGLGADEVAKILYERAACQNFFVAHAVEAIKVRPLVGNSNIFVLQGMGEDNLDTFRTLHLIPVISSWEQFEFWRQNKIVGIKPVLHIETGLNRLGFRNSDLEKLSEEDRSEFSFVMSHLACADVINHFMNEKQLSKFKEIKTKYFPNTRASLSASDALRLVTFLTVMTKPPSGSMVKEVSVHIFLPSPTDNLSSPLQKPFDFRIGITVSRITSLASLS